MEFSKRWLECRVCLSILASENFSSKAEILYEQTFIRRWCPTGWTAMIINWLQYVCVCVCVSLTAPAVCWREDIKCKQIREMKKSLWHLLDWTIEGVELVGQHSATLIHRTCSIVYIQSSNFEQLNKTVEDNFVDNYRCVPF